MHIYRTIGVRSSLWIAASILRYVIKPREMHRVCRNHAVISMVGGVGLSVLPLDDFFAGTVTQGCWRSSPAPGRASWSRSNVFWRKSWASAEISDGIVGLADEPIYRRYPVRPITLKLKADKLTLKIACIWVNCAHGCSPVSISTTKQPTLHMSALRVCEVCLTTSGAIQNTEPCKEGRFTRFPSRSIAASKKRCRL